MKGKLYINSIITLLRKRGHSGKGFQEQGSSAEVECFMLFKKKMYIFLELKFSTIFTCPWTTTALGWCHFVLMQEPGSSR